MAQEALAEVAGESELRCVGDGEELLDYLHRRGRYAEAGTAPYPAVILFDLNMPLKSGHEALGELKADARLRRIPVVVLTTSSSEDDVVKSYELGASSYLTKPVSFASLVDVMQDFSRYWLDRVELPGPSAP
jgi:CheY-like chemotaxis protein